MIGVAIVPGRIFGPFSGPSNRANPTGFNPRKVVWRMKKRSIRSLYKASGLVKTIAKRSIRQYRSDAKKLRPNPPGKPVRTIRGRIKTSIAFSVNEQEWSSVIGPRKSVIGNLGRLHEFGGMAKRRLVNWDNRLILGGSGPIGLNADGSPRFIMIKYSAQIERCKRYARILDERSKAKPNKRYPARPYMGPALTKARPKIPFAFKGILHR